MKKHELVDKIRTFRGDVATANSKLRALEVERVGHANEIARLEARLADAYRTLENVKWQMTGQAEDARYGAAAAQSLGDLLVDLELGIASERELSAEVRTVLHEVKRGLEPADEESDEAVAQGQF